MGYERIDSVLDTWAKGHSLHFLKQYKDSEVRSVEIVDASGKRYQIWIDKPDMNGLVGIHLWDFKSRGRKRDFLVPIMDLTEYLGNALEIVRTWSKIQSTLS